MNLKEKEDILKYLNEKIEHLRLRKKEIKNQIALEIKILNEEKKKLHWAPMFEELDPLLKRYLNGEKILVLHKEYGKCHVSTLKSRLFKRKVSIYRKYRKEHPNGGFEFDEVINKFFGL